MQKQEDIPELSPRHDPYASLRYRNYRLYQIGTVVANIGMQMQSAAVGWEIYERTAGAFWLGMVGLAQVLPVIVLVLPAGYTSDRFDRRRIQILMLAMVTMCLLAMAGISASGTDIRWLYLPLFGMGIARAFLQPAKGSFMPLLVPKEIFSNAVTWSSGGFHLACIVGPAICGSLLWLWPYAWYVYLLDATACVINISMLLQIDTPRSQSTREPVTLRSLGGGISFLRRSPIVFGAITLDMFAVLLGGAVALLPLYAKDILGVGPLGYGVMRAAPAIGALMMAFALAHRPPMHKAGHALLWSVVGFGLATVVFGFSRSYPLSLLMLFLTGALDNISVVIRHTLVQMLTPDAMRGRVSAINSMFIGASNELGAFESGAVAALCGPVFSVVSGGIGTVVVVAVVAWICPSLRRYGRLGS